MYEAYYGFKQRPFQLLPNPDYLFLSRSHEEAFAHLTYAITHGDGFVAIIGEVGTGKTTICRSFLEHLDPSVEAAYIVNPRMNSMELLKAINDEFGIRSDMGSIKELIDTLNAFLIERKSEGKRVIIIIDEAQNLTWEVLEQLRLTSNLETTTDKLLQIVLVGQPELGEFLHSHELRQLAQRISLNSHLVPLNEQETRDYILYRVTLAARRPMNLFSKAACRSIHQYSQGIPRLINIACDRALIVGFGLNAKKVTGKVARQAILELREQRESPREDQAHLGRRIAVLVLLFLFLVLALVYYPEWRPRRAPRTEEKASLEGANPRAETEAFKKPTPLERPRPYPKEETLPTEDEEIPLFKWNGLEPVAPSDQRGQESGEETFRTRDEQSAAPEEQDLETPALSTRQTRGSAGRGFQTPEEEPIESGKAVEETEGRKGSTGAERMSVTDQAPPSLRTAETVGTTDGKGPEPTGSVGSAGAKGSMDEKTPLEPKTTQEDSSMALPTRTGTEPVAVQR